MQTVGRVVIRKLRTAAGAAVICASLVSSQAQLGVPPVIAVQPLDLSVPNGDRIVLTSVAVSLTAMTFTWRLNGQPLSSGDAEVSNVVIPLVGTLSTLTITNVNPAHAGAYALQVANAVGSVISSNASVSVLGGIKVDQVSSAKTNAQVLSFQHTVGAGQNRLLLVATSYRDASKSVESITYGGVPLEIAGSEDGHKDDNKTTIWKLANPPSGTASVVVTFQGAARVAAGAISFTGVDQNNPITSFAGAEGKSDEAELFQSGALGDLIFDVIAANGDAQNVTQHGGQFLQWDLWTGTGGGEIIGASSIRSAAPVAATAWSLQKDKAWSLSSVVLKSAPAAPLSISAVGTGLGLSQEGFTLKLTGPAGATMVIEASDDLKVWTAIATNTVANGTGAYTDPAATNNSFRYYRIRPR